MRWLSGVPRLGLLAVCVLVVVSASVGMADATSVSAVAGAADVQTGDGVTVRLAPADANISVEDTIRLDVIVEGIDAGVGSYDLTVAVEDAGIATIRNATAGGTPDRQLVAVGEANESVRLNALGTDTADTGPVTVATVDVTGTADGRTSVSVTVDAIGDETGMRYSVTGTAGATLTVDRAVPAVTEDGNPARDPDDDGRYEDVNGDGDVTPGDATVLFNAVFEGNEAVTGNVELFDFNDDGRVTPGDATVLFNEVF